MINNDFVATQIQVNRRSDGSSPVIPLNAFQFLTFVREGMEGAPKDRDFLAFTRGRWSVVTWVNSSLGFALVDDPATTGVEFSHWCELPLRLDKAVAVPLSGEQVIWQNGGEADDRFVMAPGEYGNRTNRDPDVIELHSPVNMIPFYRDGMLVFHEDNSTTMFTASESDKNLPCLPESLTEARDITLRAVR